MFSGRSKVVRGGLDEGLPSGGEHCEHTTK